MPAPPGEPILRNPAAEAILDGIRDLPAIPATMGQILETTRDPNAGAESLARVVSLDPAVAATILRVANSPYYGQVGKVSDLGRAIVTIGFAEIAHLVLSIGVFDLARSAGGKGLDPVRFWEHSLACGILAQQMARDNGQVSGGEAFMGGLLHDIGKLAFDRSDPDRYGRVLAAARKSGRFARDAEKDEYEVNHALLGEALGRRWNLPEPVRFAMAYHHVPNTAEAVDLSRATLVRIVHLADLFVRAMCLGSSTDTIVEEFSPRTLALVRVSGAQLETAFGEIRKQLARLKESLGISGTLAARSADEKRVRPLVVVTSEDYGPVTLSHLTLASDPELDVQLALSWGQVIEKIEAGLAADRNRRVAVVVESRRKANESLFLSTALVSERIARIPVAFVGARGGAPASPRLKCVIEKPYHAARLIEEIRGQVT